MTSFHAVPMKRFETICLIICELKMPQFSTILRFKYFIGYQEEGAQTALEVPCEALLQLNIQHTEHTNENEETKIYIGKNILIARRLEIN